MSELIQLDCLVDLLLATAGSLTEGESGDEEDGMAASMRMARHRLDEEIKRDQRINQQLKLSASKQVKHVFEINTSFSVSCRYPLQDHLGV